MVFREHGEIAGVFAYGKEKDTIYVRLGFGTEEKRFLEMISRTFPGSKIEISAGCVKRGSKVPKIMFRITSLEALCRCLRSRKKNKFVLTVTDPVIGKNNGTFLFSASKDGTEICISSKKAEGELSIGDFSKAVFGYSGEDVFGEASVSERTDTIGRRIYYRGGMTMKLMFIGADHEVTGSCHYVEACGKRFLVDYGMEQGKNVYENAELPVNPSEIDFVLLS